MVFFRKTRILIVLLLLVVIFFIRYLTIDKNELSPTPLENKEDDLATSLKKLTIVIREFESFDNDVIETVESALGACGGVCTILVVSDTLVYPPLRLPPNTQHVILTADLLRPTPDLHSIFSTTYVMLLPDAARLSSPTQLRDLIRILEVGDTQAVAVGVGGSVLNCYQYSLNVLSWTLTVAPAPDSEACDAVSGRAALLMKSSNLLNLTFPFQRPVLLSMGVQGAARGWKVHVSRGSVLGESRQLYATEHLQWKLETATRERINELYYVLGVKKVVNSNRHVEWYGCTRKTQRCFPTIIDSTPSYFYQGRWTPPCCLEALRITARHVFQSLKACRVRWWLEGGSLLGAVRLGDIIPWDYDVDIGVYAPDIDKCPQLKSARWQNLEDSEGFVWQRVSVANYYKVQYSTSNSLHVDIFPFTPKSGTMMRDPSWNTGHRQDVDFPEHYLRPLSTINFAGVMASAPNNVRDFLEFKFGPGVIENPKYPNPDIMYRYNISILPAT